MRVIPLLIILFVMTGCRSEQEKDVTQEWDTSRFEAGDLVFRRGRGVVSRAVLTADRKGHYSHIGILTGRYGEWFIVHAVPGEPDFEGDIDRIKKDSLQVFFSSKRAGRGAVVRVDADPAMKRRAAEKAMDLFRRGILFDHDYDLNDTTKLYCTELIDFVYRTQGIDLPEGRISRVTLPLYAGEYLFPSDIYQCALLTPIEEY